MLPSRSATADAVFAGTIPNIAETTVEMIGTTLKGKEVSAYSFKK
jgi:hypothetical protein